MAGKRAALAGVFVVLLVCVPAADARSSARGGITPDPATLTLQASDFPGSHSVGQALDGAAPVLGAFEREIKFASPYGASRYGFVASLAILTTDATVGDRFYRILAHRFSQRRERLVLVRDYLKEAGIKTTLKSITMITPRALGVDDSSMEIGFVLRGGKTRFNLSVSVLRIDRVVDVDIAVGTGRSVALADGVALTQLAAGHVVSGLTPASVAVPEITGTAVQGQVLTATAGVWSSPPSTFAYQWQRCDSAGATCADLPGETEVAYTVTAADVGSTLRVNVTGSSRFGTATAGSVVTAVVT